MAGCRISSGFIFRSTGQRFQSVFLQEAFGNFGKGEHASGGQFREEDIAIFTQQAGQQADLSRFFRAYEIPFHVGRGGEGLLPGQAVQKSFGQASVGEGHIGKTGGGNLETERPHHDEVFHQLFARPHDVGRIGGFVGRNTEEVPGRHFRKERQQAAGVQNIVVQESRNGENILFTAHVFVGGKVGDDIEGGVMPEDFFKYRIGKADGVGFVFLRYEEVMGTAQVAGEFGQTVFADINHHKTGRLKGQKSFDEGGADGTGSADDQYGAAGYVAGEFVIEAFHVGGKKALPAAGDMFRNKILKVEHGRCFCYTEFHSVLHYVTL